MLVKSTLEYYDYHDALNLLPPNLIDKFENVMDKICPENGAEFHISEESFTIFTWDHKNKDEAAADLLNSAEVFKECLTVWGIEYDVNFDNTMTFIHFW